MGLSENRVPLHPMVLLIIIPMKNGYFIGNINPFSDIPIWQQKTSKAARFGLHTDLVRGSLTLIGQHCVNNRSRIIRPMHM